MDIKNQVVKVIASVLQTTEEKVAKDLDSEMLWDSLKKIEIILTLEDEFNISFLQEEIAQCTSVSKIIDFVSKKI